METVFLLQHVHALSADNHDVKMIGVYRSMADARAAVARLQDQPGFKYFPEVVNPDDDERSGFPYRQVHAGPGLLGGGIRHCMKPNGTYRQALSYCAGWSWLSLVAPNPSTRTSQHFKLQWQDLTLRGLFHF